MVPISANRSVDLLLTGSVQRLCQGTENVVVAIPGGPNTSGGPGRCPNPPDGVLLWIYDL